MSVPAGARRGNPVAALLRASRPLRFLIVGGLNTLACFLVYAGLVRAGVPFARANFAALVFGLCLNFTLQRRFVFASRAPAAARFARFVLAWLAIYAVQTGLIALLVRHGTDAVIAGLVVLPGTTIVSYLVQKLVVFRPARGDAR